MGLALRSWNEGVQHDALLALEELEPEGARFDKTDQSAARWPREPELQRAAAGLDHADDLVVALARHRGSTDAPEHHTTLQRAVMALGLGALVEGEQLDRSIPLVVDEPEAERPGLSKGHLGLCLVLAARHRHRVAAVHPLQLTPPVRFSSMALQLQRRRPRWAAAGCGYSPSLGAASYRRRAFHRASNWRLTRLERC